MNVEWRSITDFPDYEVSEYGDVRSWKPERNFAPRPNEPRLLKFKIDRDGYKSVALYRDNKAHHIHVHRLVCKTFNGEKPSDDFEVRHLSGDKTYNHFSNLCWGTPKQNSEDRVLHGTQIRGVQVNTCKLDEERVKFIRSSGENNKVLAGMFDVSCSLIYKIKTKEVWKHV